MELDLGVSIHKKLFPRATFNSQILHLGEEIEEYENAQTKTEQYEELGDILVIVISLFRFKQGMFIGKALLNYYYYNHDPLEREKRLKYYKKSLEKCKKRIAENRYKFIDGDYRRAKVDIHV